MENSSLQSEFLVHHSTKKDLFSKSECYEYSETTTLMLLLSQLPSSEK